MAQERKCPKCGKDYTNDGHWVQSLRRHLARKNPCDRPQDADYLKNKPVPEPPQSPLRSLDSIEWKGDAPQDKSMRFVAGWFFKEVVKDPGNVCFVRPNINKDEYWVRVSPGDVQIVRQWVFIQLWVNRVLCRLFPKGNSFEWEIQADAGIDLVRDDWDGVADAGSEFIFEMKLVLKDFMDKCSYKKQIKAGLVNFP
jgi:hypothetical protein